MNRQEFIELCVGLPFAVIDNPFDLTPIDQSKIVIARNVRNRKWFAVIFERGERTFIDLKCDPPYGEFLRENERGVCVGYHMNKRHWIGLYLDEVRDELVRELTNLSYWLTAPKKRNKEK